MFLLMKSVKGGYEAHSWHVTHERAMCWAECLEQDGSDVAICQIPDEMMNEVADVITKGR